MLTPSDLDALGTAIHNEVFTFREYKVVIDDDDVGRYARELDAENPTLILVLPGTTLKGINEDSMQHVNRLILFVLHKVDVRDYEAFLACFDTMASITNKIVDYLKKVSRSFPRDCRWKQVDMNTLSIDPIRDYYGLSGYVIDVNVRN